MDKIDGYIERVKHLPPAPTVVCQLLGLLGDPNRHIDRIVELISYDPSLTAEVLKRCNSVLFRGAEPASDIFEAVSRLGFSEVYRVVVIVVATRALSLAQTQGALKADDLWRHSVTAALAAATLASRVQEAETVAFTAGLLHDVGKLVLASVEPAIYANLVRQAGAFGSALARAEEVSLGVTHADVGARLLVRWGLPAPVTLAVLHHHQPPSTATPFERLAAIVHLANDLAHGLTGTEAPAPDLASSSPDAMRLLELTAEDVGIVVPEIQKGLARLQGLLQTTA
jgi:putative nucleotidyltransferase with HDIG domain